MLLNHDEWETQPRGESPEVYRIPTLVLPNGVRRMPVKTRRVDLDGEYEGWWAVLRVNAPFGLFLALSELQSGEDGVQAFAALADLLPKLITEWNFVDEAGEPIPCDKDGMRRIPTDLLMSLVGKLGGGDAVPKG